MRSNFKLEGIDDLVKTLGELPNAVSNRVTIGALFAGGRVLRTEMKRLVPKKTGELDKAIKVTRYTTRKAGVREVAVGVRGKESPLAHLVEFGTSPHPIEAKPGKVLAFEQGGELRFAKKVKHPGARAKPFVRPATDAKGQEAFERVREVMYTGIVREADKLAQKTRSRRR